MTWNLVELVKSIFSKKRPEDVVTEINYDNHNALMGKIHRLCAKSNFACDVVLRSESQNRDVYLAFISSGKAHEEAKKQADEASPLKSFDDALAMYEMLYGKDDETT